MYSPTARVLSALELLQSRGRLSGVELAERLGVDGRTVRRYIGKLEDLGIPILSERGRYGCYRLMPGFKLPPMVFTDDEALAVFMGLLAARKWGLAAGTPAVDAAQAKLERVMPAALAERVKAVTQAMALDQTAGQALQDTAALMALGVAAHQGQQVVLDYQSADRTANRRLFDCYGLAHRDGHWYAVGHCHLRKALRSFRLDRVQQVTPVVPAVSAKPGVATFQPPADFDVMRHLALGIATLPRQHQVQVLLRTDIDSARRALFDGVGLFQILAGGVLLRSTVDDLDWFARTLAGLRFDFEVISPPALTASLRALAARLQGLADQAPTHQQRVC